MFKALDTGGLYSIVDFTFVPFGNAYYNTKKCYHPQYERQVGLTCWIHECEHPSTAASDCFTAPLLCQHGTRECLENLVEGCVVTHYPDASKHVPFLECYEGTGTANVGDKLTKCAKNSNMDEAAIRSCASGTEGESILVANAKLTAALGTAKLGTPWILINGKSFQGNSLKTAICNAYTGTAPAGCKKMLREPGHNHTKLC